LLLVLGAGLVFLVSLEHRIKRNRTLAAIHELRSVAHIIDMHQLTKDPERLLKRWVVTEVSPESSLNQSELARYFDYCSEMLSLTSKVATLYVQDFNDEVALAAVNEVEAVTTGLSRKIWQKIMIVNTLDERGTDLRSNSESQSYSCLSPAITIMITNKRDRGRGPVRPSGPVAHSTLTPNWRCSRRQYSQ
jgi:hypothetical protein